MFWIGVAAGGVGVVFIGVVALAIWTFKYGRDLLG